LPTAQSVAEKLMALASPALNETGKLFNVREERLLEFQLPA
jgi:hypothetical protein